MNDPKLLRAKASLVDALESVSDRMNSHVYRGEDLLNAAKAACFLARAIKKLEK